MESFYKSPEMTSLRQSMLDGQEPSACKKCFSIERAGTWSYRKVMNKKYADVLSDIQQENKNQPLLNPRYLDIRIGNLCNLACRMCSPHASSKLNAEWTDFYGKPTPLVENQPLDHFELQTNWANIDLINFAGGEPLISKKVVETLKILISKDHAKNIDLRFNTNLTRVDSEILNLIELFRSVDLTVSIDGTGKINDYIRFPSNWDSIVSNLQELQTRFQGKKVTLKVNITVQIYNAFNIPKLINYMIQKFSITPSLNFLTDPGHYCIHSFPEDIKSELENHLRNEIPQSARPELVSSVIHFLRQKDTPSEFENFIRWTKFFDGRRGQDICTVVPELKRFFHER